MSVVADVERKGEVADASGWHVATLEHDAHLDEHEALPVGRRLVERVGRLDGVGAVDRDRPGSHRGRVARGRDRTSDRRIRNRGSLEPTARWRPTTRFSGKSEGTS